MTGNVQHWDGKWYRWSKDQIHECCQCGLQHDVQIKVDKKGFVWMKWTELKKKPAGRRKAK